MSRHFYFPLSNASSFDIGLVTEEVEIPLEEVKPLFTRRNFQEEESFKDLIEISKALDTYLMDGSSGPLSKGIIFVDVNTHETAYSVNGRYHFDEDQVIINAKLFKGRKKLNDFNVTGNKDQIEKIVDNILETVIGFIN